MGAQSAYCVVIRAVHRESPKTHSTGDRKMKRISNWKTIVFAAIVPLLIAFQPTVTFACESLGHCGG
jgi:hypothetical protein